MPTIIGTLIGALIGLSFVGALDSERVSDRPECITYYKDVRSLWWTGDGTTNIQRIYCSHDVVVREQMLAYWQDQY